MQLTGHRAHGPVWEGDQVAGVGRGGAGVAIGIPFWWGAVLGHRIERVSDILPPDVARLRTVVTYLRAALGRAEQALAVAETQASLDAGRRPLPEPPAC